MSMHRATEAANQRTDRMPDVVCRVATEHYALNARIVHEMVMLGRVSRPPRANPVVRGMMNLRGSVIPVIDLRRYLGERDLADETDELIGMLEQRERDHVDWLSELEACVREHRAFTLATDADQCEFGRWYNQYHTNNLVLSMQLSRFDEPHRRIHRLAEEVLELHRQGDDDQAMRRIQETRSGDLSVMVNLFHRTRDILREEQREIAILIGERQGMMAVVVDDVLAVEYLRDHQDTTEFDTSLERPIIAAAKRQRDDQLVMVLDEPKLLDICRDHASV